MRNYETMSVGYRTGQRPSTKRLISNSLSNTDKVVQCSCHKNIVYTLYNRLERNVRIPSGKTNVLIMDVPQSNNAYSWILLCQNYIAVLSV